MLHHTAVLLCICLAFPRVDVLVLIMYCSLSHMLGHVTSIANGQLYTIKINKDFLMRLLKRGDIYFSENRNPKVL